MTVDVQNNDDALAIVADTLAPSAAAFIEGARNAETLATPFGRSVIASVLAGLSTMGRNEARVIAAFGSPKGANGKEVKRISALRDMPGGFALYQAWRAVSDIIDNIDADAPRTVTVNDVEHVIGAGAIRAAVTAFALSEGDIKTIRGKAGLQAFVAAAVKADAEAEAALYGAVKQEGDEGGEGDTGADATPSGPTLAERAAAMLLALQGASDNDFADAQTELAALSDYIDSRWNTLAETLETETPHAAEIGDAVMTLAPEALAA